MKSSSVFGDVFFDPITPQSKNFDPITSHKNFYAKSFDPITSQSESLSVIQILGVMLSNFVLELKDKL